MKRYEGFIPFALLVWALAMIGLIALVGAAPAAIWAAYVVGAAPLAVGLPVALWFSFKAGMEIFRERDR